MQTDYNKLQTFVKVVEEMSITKAAKKLYLTQQAVSHQIKCLEEELQLKLLRRADRTIYLTKHGQQIYQTAQQNLQKIDNSILGLIKDLGTLEGSLKLGMVPEIGRYILLTSILEFKQSYPNIKVEAVFSDDSASENAILKGQLDFGLLVFSSESTLLKKSRIWTEEFVAVCTKSFLKKKGPVHSFQDLVELPVLGSHPHAPSLKTWVAKNDKKLAKKIVDKTAEIAFPDSQALLSMVQKDLGFAVLPKTILAEPLTDTQLVELLPGSKKIHAHIDLVRFSSKTQTLVEEKFEKFLVQWKDQKEN